MPLGLGEERKSLGFVVDGRTRQRKKGGIYADRIYRKLSGCFLGLEFCSFWEKPRSPLDVLSPKRQAKCRRWQYGSSKSKVLAATVLKCLTHSSSRSQFRPEIGSRRCDRELVHLIMHLTSIYLGSYVRHCSRTREVRKNRPALPS